MIHLKRTIAAISLTAAVVLSTAGTAAAIGTYTVRSGDYLAKIARTHGTTWQEVHSANPSIKNPNLIYPGQVIALPGASTANPQAAATAPAAPAPVPQPAPQPVAAAPALTGCELARSLINEYDWNKEVAYNVMVAESSCNPNAANMNDYHGSCAGSYSLFQVACFWYPHFGYSLDNRYSPEVNVKIAFQIWERNGSFAPWTTCKKVQSCI